jgi:hypothetical protein
MNQSKQIRLQSDNTYEWRGDSVPLSDTTLSWGKTFQQRKSFLSKRWDEYNRHGRLVLIEKMLYYSAITEIQEIQ